MSRLRFLLPMIALAFSLGACKTQTGKDGVDGEPGAQGSSGCAPGAGAVGIGLSAAVTISDPANGSFFTPGETMEYSIKFTDRCRQPVDILDLDVANLYLSGPRSGLKTKAAVKLLNCVTDRNAIDDQHHFIDLQDPHFLDDKQDNFGEAEDGTIIFRTAAVSDEEPGTYTVGVWARTKDELDQVFVNAPFQIGNAAREDYAAGRPGAFPACGRCHWGPLTGHIYMAHSRPVENANYGLSAPKRMKGMPTSYIMGNWALDKSPIETCQHCHNQDGYSPHPLAQKVHSIHRGHNMVKPGVAHPYLTQVAGGMTADESLKAYTDVGYPSMPDGEKDCAQCHIDDRWKNKPSPLGCVGCHETLDLEAGVISPPRVYGKIGKASCTDDAGCATAFGQNATCNLTSGSCEDKQHPTLAQKPNCLECHTSDDSGSSPNGKRHEIKSRTKSQGLQLTDFAIAGGSGPTGAFLPSDKINLRFKLLDRASNPVDLLAKSASGSDIYQINFVVSGPTNDRQRLVGGGGAPPSRASLALEAGSWKYTLDNPDKSGNAQGLPATSLAPLNTPAGTAGRANPAGTYTVYFYVYTNPGPGVLGGATYEATSGIANFKFCPNANSCDSEPIRPRQVILKTACTGCHVTVGLHGGMRNEPEMCSNCHTHGAVDKGPGSAGAACTKDADCKGYNADPAKSWEECQDILGANGKAGSDGVPDTCVIVAKGRKGKSCAQDGDCFGHLADPAKSWESCQDTNGDSTPDACVASLDRDPTGPASIEFNNLIHSIHYARRRGGFASKGHLLPGTVYLGHQNRANDFSEVLFPLDMRNCTKCHADTNDQCVEENDTCGFGQQCQRGKCVNVAWKADTGSSPCLACHDTEAAWAHVQINTFQPTGGTPIESCKACHGQNRQFSPAKVHDVEAPYSPPYPRTFAHKQ